MLVSEKENNLKKKMRVNKAEASYYDKITSKVSLL